MSTEYSLVICGAEPPACVFPIEEGCHTIGRDENCDIYLAHLSISRRHALLVNKNGKLWLRDLTSQNGTFVNGVAVTLCPVGEGSVIRLGLVTLELVTRLPPRRDWMADHEEPETPVVDDVSAEVLRDVRLGPMRKRIARLALAGHTEKKIAALVDRSEHTVNEHLKELYRELKVHSRSQLAAYFYRRATNHVTVH